MLLNKLNHPVRRSLTPLQRRGIVRLRRRGIGWCRTHTTTPSGFARHPSRGGEYHPVKRSLTPLQRRGIGRTVWGIGGRKRLYTTPSGFACHPSEGGELPPPEEGNWLVQIRGHHPVKRSLTPLRRRGMCYWRGPSRNTLMRNRMLASTGWSSDNKVSHCG